MIRIISFALVLFATSLCRIAAQTTPQSATPNPIGHGAFPVKVTRTLDSSKLKEGDAIEVETAGSFKLPDGTLVPKGSKLAGHVMAAKARSKGDSESELTVVFDKLNVVNGKQLSVKGAVQGVFPPADQVDPGLPGTSSHQGGGLPMPDYKPTTDIKTGVNTQSNSGVPASTDPKAVGVHGFDNLELKDGVLTSNGKNVKLGTGVRMIVRVDIFG